MDQFNFLKQMGGLKGQGDGFRRDTDVHLANAFLLADGSALTTTLTTNPGFAMAETNARVIQWAATKVIAASFNFQVPGDYDQTADELRLRMMIQMGGATDTPGFTLNCYRKTAGAAISADLGPFTAQTESSGLSPLSAQQAGTFAASAVSTFCVFDLSKVKVLAKDSLTFKITPGAHGTDAINLYALIVRYRSDLALFTEANR